MLKKFLLQDKTQNLQRHINNVRRGRTYEEVLESLQQTVPCGIDKSGSLSINSNFMLILLLTSFKIIYLFLL